MRLFVAKYSLSFDSEDMFSHVFADKDYAVWLDGNMTDYNAGRFSILAAADSRNATLIEYYSYDRKLIEYRKGIPETIHTDLFDYLNEQITKIKLESPSLPFSFKCGFVGYFGYELKSICEGREHHRSNLPDCLLLFVDKAIVIDRLNNDVYLLYLGQKNDSAIASKWFDYMKSLCNDIPMTKPLLDESREVEFKSDVSREAYLQNINRCLKYIADGDSYEICLTNKFTAESNIDPLTYYRKLRRINPAPYSSYLKFPQAAVACSSPERFLKIDADGNVETRPIKGTVRRGGDREEDEALRNFLQNDIKNHSENLMIVDLLRNDLGRVCEFGSVKVPQLMQIESYATLHQLVSTVTGKLRSDMTAVDCLRASFPGGSMTGAPKIRTMEITDELEVSARAIYSGSIGYLSLDGSADLNIVIRTAVFSDNQVSIGAGGAIVAMSNPEEEWDELILKTQALMKAF